MSLSMPHCVQFYLIPPRQTVLHYPLAGCWLAPRLLGFIASLALSRFGSNKSIHQLQIIAFRTLLVDSLFAGRVSLPFWSYYF
jgi:hypothetical protein